MVSYQQQNDRLNRLHMNGRVCQLVLYYEAYLIVNLNCFLCFIYTYIYILYVYIYIFILYIYILYNQLTPIVITTTIIRLIIITRTTLLIIWSTKIVVAMRLCSIFVVILLSRYHFRINFALIYILEIYIYNRTLMTQTKIAQRGRNKNK